MREIKRENKNGQDIFMMYVYFEEMDHFEAEKKWFEEMIKVITGNSQINIEIYPAKNGTKIYYKK